MNMARSTTLMIGGLCLALLAAGCTDPRDLQIQSLTDQLEACQRENDGLRGQLARLANERDGALARNGALFDRVRELELELAKKPAGQPLPEGWQAGPEGTAWVDVGDNILFRQGYANLQPEGKAALQRIVNDINAAFPNKLIVVIGHTDDVPITTKKHLYKDNLDLSVTRGCTVFREMADLGISPNRMIAAGQGEFAPKAIGTDDASRRLNRRVQILAVPLPRGGVASSAAMGLEPTGSALPAGVTEK